MDNWGKINELKPVSLRSSPASDELPVLSFTFTMFHQVACTVGQHCLFSQAGSALIMKHIQTAVVPSSVHQHADIRWGYAHPAIRILPLSEHSIRQKDGSIGTDASPVCGTKLRLIMDRL